ncbi:MAG: tryptophan-rich sensory protein [Clostridia bacterium]|nr:tryptophan-rich sensory protein [Clostridia bacterium]
MENKKRVKRNYIIIILSLILIAGLGSVFVNLGMDWFETLKKPTQFIPNFLIPIMWTIIYLTYGIILCLWSWKEEIDTRTKFLLVLNGLLNLLWCLTFFTFNLTFLGLVFIVLLLISSYFLIFSIKDYNKIYFYFGLIYPIWVSLATTLNLSLWILN